jgi:hypothetical protein
VALQSHALYSSFWCAPLRQRLSVLIRTVSAPVLASAAAPSDPPAAKRVSRFAGLVPANDNFDRVADFCREESGR